MEESKTYKKVKCLECTEELYRITNTHLWKAHRMTIDEYKKKYPDAEIEDKELALYRQNHKRGKTYEQIYGEEVGRKKRVEQINNAIEQFCSDEQRERRCVKKGSTSKEVREKLSESNTIHGDYVYRRKALENFENECAACGKIGDVSIHHKDCNH
jgi:hypothetical protein